LTSEFYAGGQEIFTNNIDTKAAVAGYCNQWCHADQTCTSDIQDACRTIARGSLPFCTSSCYADCRTRYQATDTSGGPEFRYGRPEDLAHNLLEIREAQGGRLIQKIFYGLDPKFASFDRVEKQVLADQSELTNWDNEIRFVYFDLERGPDATSGAWQPLHTLPIQILAGAQVLGDSVFGNSAGLSIGTRASVLADGIVNAPPKPAWLREATKMSDWYKDIPISYVDDLSSFSPVEVCPARCIRRAPPLVPRPFRPEFGLPGLGLPPHPADADRWVIAEPAGREAIRLRIPEPRNSGFFGLGSWTMQGVRGMPLVLSSSRPGEYQLDASDVALRLLFGGSGRALLAWTPAGSPVLLPVDGVTRDKVWREIKSPSPKQEHVGEAQYSRLGIVLERTGRSTARGQYLGLTPGSETSLLAANASIRMIATPNPAVFLVPGAPRRLAHAPLRLLAGGELWLAPTLSDARPLTARLLELPST
jgi:hypothetical protein